MQKQKDKQGIKRSRRQKLKMLKNWKNWKMQRKKQRKKKRPLKKKPGSKLMKKKINLFKLEKILWKKKTKILKNRLFKDKHD